jgi:hypothetical protein
LAWSACGLAFVLAGLAVVLAILNGLEAQTLFADFLPGLALDAIAFATLGAVIASRRPDHRIGWLLCTIGLGAGLGALGGQYARYGLITEPGMVVGAALASWWGCVGVDHRFRPACPNAVTAVPNWPRAIPALALRDVVAGSGHGGRGRHRRHQSGAIQSARAARGEPAGHPGARVE